MALVLPSFPVSIRDMKLLSESRTLIPFLGVVLGLNLDNDSGQIQINISRLNGKNQSLLFAHCLNEPSIAENMLALAVSRHPVENDVTKVIDFA